METAVVRLAALSPPVFLFGAYLLSSADWLGVLPLIGALFGCWVLRVVGSSVGDRRNSIDILRLIERFRGWVEVLTPREVNSDVNPLLDVHGRVLVEPSRVVFVVVDPGHPPYPCDFKSFPSERRTSFVFLLSRPREMTSLQKFYLNHELGHLSPMSKAEYGIRHALGVSFWLHSCLALIYCGGLLDFALVSFAAFMFSGAKATCYMYNEAHADILSLLQEPSVDRAEATAASLWTSWAEKLQVHPVLLASGVTQLDDSEFEISQEYWIRRRFMRRAVGSWRRRGHRRHTIYVNPESGLSNALPLSAVLFYLGWNLSTFPLFATLYLSVAYVILIGLVARFRRTNDTRYAQIARQL